MLKIKKDFTSMVLMIPKILQMVLNITLSLLAIILSFLLVKELVSLIQIMIESDPLDHQLFLTSILTFFLYFEFITMIVKYFKEHYHFPLRYFIYIGITAMVRLIIVEHHDPVHTLLYSLVILILIIGYFIMNLTPRERPDSRWFFKK